jgi:hypothetical protein
MQGFTRSFLDVAATVLPNVHPRCSIPALSLFMILGNAIAQPWLFEVVDSLGDVGRASSLVLDCNGFPHISYVDHSNDALKYAWRDTAGWQIEAVDGPSVLYFETSLALGADGMPHVAYVRSGDQKYAYRDEAGWHVETVAAMGSVWTSLALDPNGFPHIAFDIFYHAGDKEITGDRINVLQYVFNDGSGWQIETPDGGSGEGQFCSLVVDNAGYPHIYHWEFSYDTRRYCWKDMTGWHVDVADGHAFYSSLVLDEEGLPHVSYTTGEEVHYAWKDASGWSVQTVSTEKGVFYTSLGLDDLGFPHISYCNYDENDLRYAFFDGSYWWIETVAAEGVVGWDNSLCLDALRTPHISYYDHTDCNLVYAYLIPSTTVSGGLVGPLVHLTWSVVPGAAGYWVYGVSGNPFFVPDLTPPYNNRLNVLPQGMLTWLSPYPTGSPGYGWTYLVVAATVGGQEICTSNRVGEASFIAEIAGR